MTAMQSVLTLWAATSVPVTLAILEMDTPVQVNQQHTPCQITKSLAAIIIEYCHHNHTYLHICCVDSKDVGMCTSKKVYYTHDIVLLLCALVYIYMYNGPIGMDKQCTH